ncbi:uncharacterized protein [Ptychodera flava]|uniref:uncharacterized protein n=1 Tax=Ptychodera flava TaxID=63121 RepID=UPI00396A4B14
MSKRRRITVRTMLEEFREQSSADHQSTTSIEDGHAGNGASHLCNNSLSALETSQEAVGHFHTVDTESKVTNATHTNDRMSLERDQSMDAASDTDLSNQEMSFDENMLISHKKEAKECEYLEMINSMNNYSAKNIEYTGDDWLIEHLKLQSSCNDDLNEIGEMADENKGNDEEATADAPTEKDFTDYFKTQSEAEDTYASDRQPIFPSAKLSVGVSMLLIITYVLKYHLSGEALTDLLQLINLHCAASHPGLQSIHVFFKYFQKLQNPLVFHHYCSSCLFKLDDPSVVICPNDVCHNDLSKHGAKSFFIEIPIEAQLQSLFSRGNFYDDLAHRFRRKKKHQKDIADIYDGSLYQRHFVNNGILSHQENISLMWNTDGVPVFKSSSYSLWPLYLTINELPLDKRTKNEKYAVCWIMVWFFKATNVDLPATLSFDI